MIEVVIELNHIDQVKINGSTITDEITTQEEELKKNNKTIKIILEIEFDESKEDKILVTADVNNDYSYNETDFFIHKNNKIKDGVGKKEIEIKIPVLNYEKFVKVCAFYYEEGKMKFKQLDIKNKKIMMMRRW